ncbi:Arrestin-N domain-containing protein [Mycena sanguinolenta]|uniref:Arrestin-N domain-containing protein n=1 Tax=Mycena sanguinolenta TaxID=230812 RepID=A0A8H6Y234_9AGAR|nr:Arrestin-N domain-containing protein [Mycena sanguinolenta]
MAANGTPSTETDGPVTLYFHDITRVAGETVTGQVDLDVALAQRGNLEHLQITLKGTIYCRITGGERRGGTTTDRRQTIIVNSFNLNFLSVANKGLSSFLIAIFVSGIEGLHFLHLALIFCIARSNFCYRKISRRQCIACYALELVGKRAGFYSKNLRIRRVISVVPSATQRQLLTRESLRQGWDGPWRDFTKEEKLRQGIWGEYSRARVRLTIPDMVSYPTATAIPFSFHVETETKMMPSSGAPVDKHGKPLFPAPPAVSSHVKLVVHRRAEVRADRFGASVEDDFIPEGSLGDVAQVQQFCEEPEWIPSAGLKDEKDRGIWKRAVHFHSAVVMPYAPTTLTRILGWRYTLVFVVPFPGIGNNLKLEIPLHLHPASTRPSLPGSTNYADVVPAGPPPLLDLPPSYWAQDEDK